MNNGSATQALDTFLVLELFPIAKTAADPTDFGARVPCIMSALFLYAREFNPHELQSIFDGIVPNTVDGEEPKVPAAVRTSSFLSAATAPPASLGFGVLS